MTHHGARLMLPHPLMGLVDVALFGGSAVAVTFGVVEATAPVDWQGLSGFVLALGGLATALGGLWAKLSGLERSKDEADARAAVVALAFQKQIDVLTSENLRLRQNVHAVRNDQQAMMLEVASNSSLLKNNPLNVNVVNPTDHPIPVVTPDPGGERAD